MLHVTINHSDPAERRATTPRQKDPRVLLPARNFGQLITQALRMIQLRKTFLMPTLE
jgi:hypothetical protein